MTRRECLDAAAAAVLEERAREYGNCFDRIAEMWSVYIGGKITPWDVCAMMALLKIARIAANPEHMDSWADLAGYAACGAEVTKPAPEPED